MCLVWKRCQLLNYINFCSAECGTREKNINYRYSQTANFINTKTNIVLFKATKLDILNNRTQDYDCNMPLMFEYYAKHTDFNNLDKVLQDNNITLKLMDCGHFSWVHDNLSLKNIANTVRTCLFQLTYESEIS